MTDFERVVRDHSVRYPLMQPQDYGKLAYQSEFGPEHLVTDEREVADGILREWQAVSAAEILCNPEPIGNGLCRFHLTAARYSADAAAVLAKLFIASAKDHAGTREGLEARLLVLGRLPVAGMGAWLDDYRRLGCPPVRHSEAYRSAYRPHYRVLTQARARRFPMLLAARPET